MTQLETKQHPSWHYVPIALIPILFWASAFAGAKIGFEYMPGEKR